MPRKEKTHPVLDKKDIPAHRNVTFLWCRLPDSNRHGLFARGILSPLRLPFRQTGKKNGALDNLVPREGLEPSTP